MNDEPCSGALGAKGACILGTTAPTLDEVAGGPTVDVCGIADELAIVGRSVDVVGWRSACVVIG